MEPITAMLTDSSALLLLLNWMSPAFPTGSFAYSHGLEYAIASGDVQSANDVEHWIADLLQAGSAWNDAVLFAQCWTHDARELNELALALAGSAERHLETTQLGRSFRIAASTWTDTPLTEDVIAYPVAAGTFCKVMNIQLQPAATAFQQGFCAAMVSVAVRIVPLGQTAGLHVLKNLMPVIEKTMQRAACATLDDLGSNTLLSDIAAMKHETLEPRVFRT
jgi:urease accessory protein